MNTKTRLDLTGSEIIVSNLQPKHTAEALTEFLELFTPILNVTFPCVGTACVRVKEISFVKQLFGKSWKILNSEVEINDASDKKDWFTSISDDSVYVGDLEPEHTEKALREFFFRIL